MASNSNDAVYSRHGRRIKIKQSPDFVYYYYLVSKRTKSRQNKIDAKLENDNTKSKESNGPENKQNTDDSDDDLEITNYIVGVLELVYSPVNLQWQRATCQSLNLKLHYGFNTVVRRPLKLPIETKKIGMDGNCFFRCLSYVVTGSEDYHLLMRQKTVECYRTNNNLIKRFKEFGTKDELYLNKLDMKENGVWATSDEIFAATGLLNTNIFTYHTSYRRWLFYININSRTRTITNDANGIYLINIRDLHYEVVTNVE